MPLHEGPGEFASSADLAQRLRLPLALRLAFRELSGGLRGFGIFFACLALGVWAIAGVGSMSRSLTEALARDGRVILGGDMAFGLQQREATGEERAFLDARGRVSSVASLRAMANAGDKGTTLVELKAVDAAYPLVGAMTTDPSGPLSELTAQTGDAYGAIAVGDGPLRSTLQQLQTGPAR